MSPAERIAQLMRAGDAASRALAAGASIDFLAPGFVDDLLVAECLESARAGRRGIYDAKVTNQKGETIAVFRGRSATVRGTWIE